MKGLRPCSANTGAGSENRGSLRSVRSVVQVPHRGEDGEMPQPDGFEYSLRDDDVVITHGGRRATVLRGAAADRFRSDVKRDDPQLLMARVTGQYKRGNEKVARSHPRNRER